jgi:hypothetical protein
MKYITIQKCRFFILHSDPIICQDWFIILVIIAMNDVIVLKHMIHNKTKNAMI